MRAWGSKTVTGPATLCLSLALAIGSTSPAKAQDAPARQTEADAYSRYELLAPGSAKFRIIYEVSATTPGARYYFNPIRTGSIATDERVSDRATGKPLQFDIVGAAVARAGGVRVSDSSQQYIRVTLARPVPANGGEGRVLIDKTYEDATSYTTDGAIITFNRPLGIKRNAVVLPRGYELISCNYPSQVLQEADGRIAISFWNATPAQAPLVLRARPTRSAGSGTGTVSSMSARLGDRAYQNREIVYFLQQPETHAFDLYHDYTESRPGVSTYVNIVRGGSTVSRPSARNLDTGDTIPWQIVKGNAVAGASPGASDVTANTEAVVFSFRGVKSGESVRLRMSETYTDSGRYGLKGDELVWDRAFGRPTNAVVLPAGWMLTNSSMPAVVSELADGRIRLDFVNPRPDELAVLITARRRGSAR